MSRRLALPAVALAAIAMLPFAAGCSKTTSTVAPRGIVQGDPPPEPSTPAGAVRRLVWAFNARQVDPIAELLTADFQFVSAGLDSAGNPTWSPWTRDGGLQALQGLFYGTPERPPAESITLLFDMNLITFPDTRPGKNPRWHKQIRTSVDLKVRIDTGNTLEATGNALFFLTRGDSAAIPSDLVARGVKPDSLRWSIDRMENETLAGGFPRAGVQPTRMLTLQAILALYLP